MEDYQKVWMLLDIVHKAAAAGPAFAWFGTQATEMLMKIQAAPVPSIAQEHTRQAPETEHPQPSLTPAMEPTAHG